VVRIFLLSRIAAARRLASFVANCASIRIAFFLPSMREELTQKPSGDDVIILICNLSILIDFPPLYSERFVLIGMIDEKFVS
jgi:hypothetical protein